MGKAIVVGLTLIIIVVAVLWVIHRYIREANKQGDLNLKQERELRHLVEDAHRIMLNLGAAYSIEDTDVLSPRSEQSVNEWINSYETWHFNVRKEIDA